MTWAQPCMPVNEILRDEITKLDYTLIPPGFRGDVRAVRLMQDSLSKYLDNLGELSARAQGLNKVITTAEKLVKAPTHILYLLKDAEANNGAGEVIGLLKVGLKKLYLFDRRDQVLETEPLCVLDFYVLKARQRHGLGKALFDHMIQDQGVLPKQMAIDGPSDKMATFLKKNYGVSDLVRQSNNFAVSAEFFNKDDTVRSGSGRTTPLVQPGTGRYSASKPHSSIAGVIHGGGSYVTETTNGW